ncbi:MAG: hypothetical protein JWO53_43, partial [Chlamydiia bacterium]|nr:hypothetical protein [Chlamydiia bacterium]
MTLQVGNRDTFTASKAVLGNKETTLGSRVRSGIEGLRYYIDWTFLNECKGQKAELFTRYLKDAPRHVSIREALNDARTVTVKTFLKDVKGSVDSRIRKLKNELLAFQLGMDAVLFDLPCNAGFLKFASSPPLERYLFEYNHQLQVDPLTQEIQILADGKYM